MADFPVCPSSERTMSVLPPFCLWLVKMGRFFRKVVSISLFVGTLSSLKDRTAQSLRPSGPAPFTQGSLCRIHPRTIERYRAGHTQMKRLSAGSSYKEVLGACRIFPRTIHWPARSPTIRSIYSQTPARFSLTALLGIRITIIPYCSRYRVLSASYWAPASS